MKEFLLLISNNSHAISYLVRAVTAIVIAESDWVAQEVGPMFGLFSVDG